MVPLADRFWTKVSRRDSFGPCWMWLGARTKEGYGHIREGGRGSKMLYAHRLVYEMWWGPIQEGKQIDHTCRIHDCVNPHHLEAVTQQENITRGNGHLGWKKRDRNALGQFV
jgi:hypothetical protein